ncbi:MAG: hypothetical protein NTX15_10980 [Candidatus Kapabacteria bacterium]|nr:hypothetical protein [Candidatus Kapabacteria bacterium]
MINRAKPARCTFYVQDWADNIHVDSVTFTPTTSIDTLPPQITADSIGVDRWVLRATELRNIPLTPPPCPLTPIQLESGLRDVGLLTVADCFNVDVQLSRQLSSDSLQPTKSVLIRAAVHDPSVDARCVLSARDWAGNIATDSVQYSAPTTVQSPDPNNSVQVRYEHGVLFVRSTSPAPIGMAVLYNSRGEYLRTLRADGNSHQESITLSTGAYWLLRMVDDNCSVSPFLVVE